MPLRALAAALAVCLALPMSATDLAAEPATDLATGPAAGPATGRAAPDVPRTAETVAARIDLANRQHMLVERMAKKLCNAQAEVGVFGIMDMFATSKAAFEHTHEGLLVGDGDLALFREGRDEVLAAWARVHADWWELGRLYDAVLAGQAIPAARFDRAIRLTADLRGEIDDLVARLRQVYSGALGTGGFGQAILIDLYGRGRMLSQKLGKELCLAATGYDRDRFRAEMAQTLDVFEASLDAFIEGMPEAGVPRPPHPRIEATLRRAREQWAPARDIAHRLARGGEANLDELALVAESLNAFLVEMDEAVGQLAAERS